MHPVVEALSVYFPKYPSGQSHITVDATIAAVYPKHTIQAKAADVFYTPLPFIPDPQLVHPLVFSPS